MFDAASPIAELQSPPGPLAPAVPRRKRLRWLDALLDGAWNKGLASRPSLDPDWLMARARAQSGLTDLGDDQVWRRSLEILSGALRDQAALSSLGLTIAHGQLVAALRDRLLAQALFARRPEILDQPIAAPILVVGQMRSGTTRVQRLLACDRGLAHTRFFESWNPVPRGTGRIDDRRLRAIGGIVATRLLNPDFESIHPTTLDSPDEEIGLHSLSIFGSAFEAQWRVPAFARHCETIDVVPVYREFRRLLQLLAWLRGDPGDRPLIIKLPQLTQDLAAVLEVFPDARVIALRRDPVPLVASSASLVCNQMVMQSDQVDRHWIGREWLRKGALRSERTRAALDGWAGPRVVLHYDAVGADWRGEIARVYRMLERDLTPDTIRRMEAFVVRSAGRRPHRYALEPFGLSEAEVRAAIPA